MCRRGRQLVVLESILEVVVVIHTNLGARALGGIPQVDNVIHCPRKTIQPTATNEEHPNYLQKHPNVSQKATFGNWKWCSNPNARQGTQTKHEIETSMHMPSRQIEHTPSICESPWQWTEKKTLVHAPMTLESPRLQLPDRQSSLQTGDNEAQMRKGYIDPAGSNGNGR